MSFRKMNNLKLASIIELANLLAKQNEFREILRIVPQRAGEILKAKSTLILMINPRTHKTIKTVFKETQEDNLTSYHVVRTYFSGWAIDHNSGFYSEDFQHDDRFKKELFKGLDIKSVMCSLLRVEGIIIGTLLLIDREDGTLFDKSDFEFLENLSTVVSPFLRNTQKIEDYFIQQKIPGQALLNKYKVCGLLGKSKAFQELLRTIDAATNSDARVLLQGKSGTGKELIARAIHNYSARNTEKFIAVDCGAIPEHLIESELFGHTKGAFTGAVNERKGLFEETNNGTLFLDEIANLPMELQAKLLRALQEGEIRPLGSNTTRKVNVRVISASSEPLKELVDKRRFREDLFYRLMVFPINIPLLEERKEDIPILANHFLLKFAGEQHKKTERFHEEIIDFMKRHEWSGNIRELENFIERLVTLAPQNAKQIDSSLLPSEYLKELKNIRISNKQDQKTKSLAEALSDQEKQIMKQVLTDNDWNQSAAAKVLGIHESTLRYKMQKYKIKRSQ